MQSDRALAASRDVLAGSIELTLACFATSKATLETCSEFWPRRTSSSVTALPCADILRPYMIFSCKAVTQLSAKILSLTQPDEVHSTQQQGSTLSNAAPHA